MSQAPNRKIYSREALLERRNVEDDPRIIALIPEEIRVTQLKKVDTLFNNHSPTCRRFMLNDKNRKDDLDPGSSAMIACGA